ncbi:phosphotransferase family protein [Luteimicrobium album]|uniref:phosphotransferase family protein n=1 Tax=Luteimicrobium album TaxID=1054550 RepID=UPI0024E069E4|nr:aminoglycoside phosphotransferase family protein [Luteimicrobium album]
MTKNRQDAGVLAAMVERAYGAAAVPRSVGGPSGWCTELGNGWFNVAYRIRLRDGRDVALKIAPPSDVEVLTHERDAMEVELAAMDVLRSHVPDLVPRIDHVDRTHDLANATWFFMEFVEGSDLGVLSSRLSFGERERQLENVGRLNRRLNDIPGESFGRIVEATSGSWRTVFVTMVEDVLSDGERRAVDLGLPYDVVRATVARHASVLDDVVTPRFVERDLWDSNVMVRDGRIVALIDHERAMYADPLMEYGFIGSQLPAFGHSSAFLRGYGTSSLSKGEALRVRLYGLHLAVTMAVEPAYRGHTDARQHEFAVGQVRAAVDLLNRGSLARYGAGITEAARRARTRAGGVARRLGATADS